ncbi:hypothetical protein ONZ51_g6399 [Trametes cubensis]|uniref:ACB domain-containing protein n=1 Tax=Trametes cubensis TaxID=1111947 RepID=A0AAD7TS89_9APHY|nr:hypothetical protein ONZ51_g6399 [Trametes cubensis]
MSQAKFEKAVAIVQSLPKEGPIQPTQEEQLYVLLYLRPGLPAFSPYRRLQFYKYYKQATVGDVNTSRPGMLDFVGKAKWDAWKSVEGTSKEEAYAKYVEKLIEILKRADTEEAKKYIAEIEAA